MNQMTKVVIATSLSVGTLLGATSVGAQLPTDAHAATAQKAPYYTYKGVFNYKSNNALEDKNFYQALKADNFKYEGLKVGQSTRADVEKALGKDLKKYYAKKGITYYEKNDVIIGIDDHNKLVNLTLLVDKVEHSDKAIRDHVKSGEIFDAKTTQVAFYPGNSIVIKAKGSMA